MFRIQRVRRLQVRYAPSSMPQLGCSAQLRRALFDALCLMVALKCRYIDSNRLPSDRRFAGPAGESEEEFTNRIVGEFDLRAAGANRLAALALAAQRRTLASAHRTTGLIPVADLSDPEIVPELQFR